MSYPFQPQRSESRKAGRLQCMGASCQFGPLTDLSRNGAKVVCKKPMSLPEGATVNLRIEVMDAAMLVPARPTSSRKRADGRYDVGFQFVHVDERMGRALVQMMLTAAVNHEYKPRKIA